MSFVRDSASCVAAGRFNPAILVPDWIVKQGILSEAHFEATATMGSPTTVFTMAGLQWHATLARLEVMAEKEGADPGEFVAQILERLEHTPLRAVGSNFHFSITSPAVGEKLYRLGEFGLVKAFEPDSLTFLDGTAIAAYSFEDAVLRVSLEFEKSSATTIGFNFNRDSLSAKDGAAAARRWGSDKEAAQRIAQSLIED